MVQKLTKLVPSNRCGIWLIMVIHTYTKLSRIASPNHFFKASVRQVPPLSLLKKKKIKNFYVLSSKLTPKRDGSHYRSSNHSSICLKKRLAPLGRNVYGPISHKIKRKKAISSFTKIL